LYRPRKAASNGAQNNHDQPARGRGGDCRNGGEKGAAVILGASRRYDRASNATGDQKGGKMTTTSADQNRVTVHTEYVFVEDGPCHHCAMMEAVGLCSDKTNAFPCCVSNGRNDGKRGNFQEVRNA